MKSKKAWIGVLALAAAIPMASSFPSNVENGDPATRLPNGRQLSSVQDGVYPQDYFPNTEMLAPDEMRIIALGTGMPQVIQKKTKASGWYVELGNGEKFLFDLGTGSMENLAALRPDWSQVDKVFLSHLHSDHAGDFAPLYIGGWMNGRYTPLYLYGPTGARPELGTKAFVENQIKAWAWDIEGRKGTFPDGGGKAEVKPRLAVGYHIWPNPEFFNETLRQVRATYDGPYVQATDLTVINVTDEQIVVREAVVSELALPTGTTKGYIEAYRSKVDANTKISEFIANGRWKGFKPRPLPDKRQ